MGKMKTEKRSRKALADEIIEEETEPQRKPRPGKKVRDRQDDDDQFIGDKLSKRILQQARAQQDELDVESGITNSSSMKTSVSLGSTQRDHPNSSEDEEEEDEEFGAEEYYEDVVVDEADERAIEEFMSSEPKERRTLANVIMSKIDEKKTEIESHMSERPSRPALDDRIVSVFKSVATILSKYRSGKLPKPFKIIPSLENWEEILYLTEPDNWTAAAHYQATRIFVSNLNAKMAQRFFNLVLLPRIRDDISEYKRLNYHLYMSMKKALFKPAAFFKGILLPLCESGTCTLREAVIVSSALSKVSIPVLHSAAAMLKIAEMEYSGANSIFLRILLDKKYALPFRVIDALVHHFSRFQTDRRQLPVLWHQAFLVFVQRYKEDISSEQKDALLELCRKHNHPQITAEIRRELTHSKSRDIEVPEEAVGISMDNDD